MNHILTDRSVTILGSDFVPKTMPSDHPAFDSVVVALKANDNEAVERLMDLPSAIVNFMQGEVQITERALYYKGRPLDTSLTRRILQFMDEGDKSVAQPLINFLEKVMLNPSRRAVQGLYEWCEKSKLPITPEGDILAWKIVRDDYLDVHSGTFDNSVGKVVEVERYDVDEDPDRTCSYGLHFCSTGYLPSFGGYNEDRRVMIVRIDPADVVAFPRDYNTAKGRCQRYTVLGEIPAAKAKDFFPSVVSNYSGAGEVTSGPLEYEIVLDERYLTRDGQVVLIETYDHEDSTYPFGGDVDGTTHWWTANGAWQDGEDDHPFDLIRMLEDGEEAPDVVEKPKGFLSWLFGGR